MCRTSVGPPAFVLTTSRALLQYNGVWHCFVGRNFGAFFTHETGSHIYFYEGQTAVNLFKTA